MGPSFFQVREGRHNNRAGSVASKGKKDVKKGKNIEKSVDKGSENVVIYRC